MFARRKWRLFTPRAMSFLVPEDLSEAFLVHGLFALFECSRDVAEKKYDVLRSRYCVFDIMIFLMFVSLYLINIFIHNIIIIIRLLLTIQF